MKDKHFYNAFKSHLANYCAYRAHLVKMETLFLDQMCLKHCKSSK